MTDIDPSEFIPDKAKVLGRKIGLTAEIRSQLSITTIAACDETPAQRVARRRERDRMYRRYQRAQAGSVTRAQWLRDNSLTRDKPWRTFGISRAQYYRRRRSGEPMHSSDSQLQPRRLLGRGDETGVSPTVRIVAADGPVSWFPPRSLRDLMGVSEPMTLH
jgi:hypothetical protein